MMPDLVIRTRPYHIRFHYQSPTFGDHPEYFKCESFQKFAITLKNVPIQSTEFLRMKNSRQRTALTILCQNQFTVFKLLLSRDKLSLYCWATAFVCMIRMKRKKKVNFVIVVNSNASTCWRLTFKLWIIISGSWLVILNSKSRQVRGQEQSWLHWLTGYRRTEEEVILPSSHFVFLGNLYNCSFVLGLRCKQRLYDECSHYSDLKLFYCCSF